MDFDDLDEPTKAPPRTSRFAPKSSKFQPKPKQPPAKSEPKVEQPPAVQQDGARAALPVAVKKEEETQPLSSSATAAKMDCDGDGEASHQNGAVEAKEEEKEEVNGDAREEDGEDEVVEEDEVVSEYAVHFIPHSDADTQLYVLQYPLRPSWRPYELEQRCTEVRVKPDSAEVEVDLSIDVDSDNYDRDASSAQKMKKQTLRSLWRPPQATGYAVGVLMGKKLHLNPIRAVVQLRPSMEYLDSGGTKKRNIPDIAVKVEGSSSEALVGPSRKQNKQMDPEVVESWVPLKYHSTTSDLSKRYLRNMVAEEEKPLQFSMNPYDYLNSLCPGTVINKMKSRGPSRRSLLSLPLEERVKRLLVEGPPVQRFSAIKHLAPDDPVEDVLQVLQRYAHLVQGLWVPKTALQHPKAQGAENLARDYALLLFSQSPVIKDSELDFLGSQKSVGKAVLREIAVERPYCKDWKFREPTDVSFIKLYPDIVEKQRKLWEDNEKRILEVFARRRAGPGLKGSARTDRIDKLGASIHSAEGAAKATNGARSVQMSMSKETREALPKILRKLFQTLRVCSFQAICQGLRDMAVSMSTLPKADARAAVAAALSVDAPQEELQAVISEIAVNVHGVYVLKSSLEHPEFNPLRNVVIDLFLGSAPNAKLKKGEIIEAAKIKLQKEPTNNEFQKHCQARGSPWARHGIWQSQVSSLLGSARLGSARLGSRTSLDPPPHSTSKKREKKKTSNSSLFLLFLVLMGIFYLFYLFCRSSQNFVYQKEGLGC